LARRVTTEAELARVDDFESANFSPAEKAVLCFTEAFYRDHRTIPASVWEGLRQHYSEPEIIELAWTIASYTMLGKLIYAFQVPYGDSEQAEHAARP